MTEYQVNITLHINADSKAEALDIVRNQLGSMVEIELSSDTEVGLFEELGVKYD